MDAPEIKSVFKLALRVGEILLANGAATRAVEATMQQIAKSYDLPRCYPDASFTSLSLSLDHPDLDYPLTKIRRVRQHVTNYPHLVMVSALVDRLQRDKLSPEAALSALEELERKPINDPLWIRLLSWAGVCAASTLLLGGNALEIVVCFLIVLPAQFCRQWIAEKNVPSPVGDLFAAFLVTAIALIISRGRLAVSTNIVIAGSLFGLVPGAAIVSSAQDLIGGDLLSSAARGLEAILIGAAIAAGVGFTLDIGVHLLIGTEVSRAGTVGWSWPWQIVAACVVSLCYGRALSIPRSALLSAGCIGGCGWLISLLIPQSRGQELFLATLLSTLVVGCISRIIATFQRVPVSVYTIPGVVPFLPGLTVYQGMLAIVQGQSTNGVILLIQSVAIAGTIAMGIALSSFIDPTLTHLRHPLQMHRKE